MAINSRNTKKAGSCSRSRFCLFGGTISITAILFSKLCVAGSSPARRTRKVFMVKGFKIYPPRSLSHSVPFVTILIIPSKSLHLSCKQDPSYCHCGRSEAIPAHRPWRIFLPITIYMYDSASWPKL